MSKLSAKHELFCQAYVKHHGNATFAYREIFPTAAAQSARTNAYKLTQHPQVKKRIAELLEENNQKVHVNVNQVLSDIQKGKELALKGSKPNLVAFARFIEMEGKYLKMFTDRIEIDLSSKSDKELLKEFKDVADQLGGVINDID